MEKAMKTFVCICLMLSLIVGGCKSQPKEESPVAKQNKEIKQETEPKEVVKEKVAPKVDEVKPAQIEPQEDPNVNWEEREMQEQEWEDARALYVLQYLNKPASIVWGLKNSIPKGVAFYLEKGYGIYWNPSSTKRPKDLETGFLYARLKREENLQESLQSLEKLGKGEHYYLLAYITSWHYCLNGKNKQAKQLLEEENLAKNLVAYGIEIPEEQIALLLAKAQE